MVDNYIAVFLLLISYLWHTHGIDILYQSAYNKTNNIQISVCKARIKNAALYVPKSRVGVGKKNKTYIAKGKVCFLCSSFLFEKFIFC